MNKKEEFYKFLFEEYDIINPVLTFDGDYLLGDHNLAKTKYNPKKDLMVLNSKVDKDGKNMYLDFYNRKVLFNFEDPRFDGIIENYFYPLMYNRMDKDGKGRHIEFNNLFTLMNLIEDKSVMLDKLHDTVSAIDACVEYYKNLRHQLKDVLLNGTSSEYYDEIKFRYDSIGKELNEAGIRSYLDTIKNIIFIYRCLTDLEKNPIKVTLDDLLKMYDRDKLILMYCRSILYNQRAFMNKVNQIDSSFVIVSQIVQTIESLKMYDFNPKIKVYNEQTRKVEDYSFKDMLKEFRKLSSQFGDRYKAGQIEMDKLEKMNLVRNNENYEKFVEILSEDEQSIISTQFDILPKGEGESHVKGLNSGAPLKTKKIVDNDDILYRKLIFKNTEYVCQIVGRDKFNGYIGFIYENGLVVFEKFYEDDGSPAKDNATYIMNRTNFLDFIQLSKPEIIDYIKSTNNPDIIRKYHTENWANNLAAVIESKEKDVDSILFAHSISDDTIGSRS